MSESGIETNAALAPGPARLEDWQRVRVTMAQFHCTAPEPAVKTGYATISCSQSCPRTL